MKKLVLMLVFMVSMLFSFGQVSVSLKNETDSYVSKIITGIKGSDVTREVDDNLYITSIFTDKSSRISMATIDVYLDTKFSQLRDWKYEEHVSRRGNIVSSSSKTFYNDKIIIVVVVGKGYVMVTSKTLKS